MLYWNEIINDLAKILTWFCSICFYVYMTKLQMFYVWAFRHATDINTIVLFCPNRPEHILVNTCNSFCDVKGADVVLTSRETNSMFPLRYYANCVSTMLTVLITLKVSICFIVILYMNEQIDIQPSLLPNAYNYLTEVHLFVMNITAAYFSARMLI
jgi:hypothetical protein